MLLKKAWSALAQCPIHICRDCVCIFGFSLSADFPGGSGGKASAYNSGDAGLIPGWDSVLEEEMAAHSSILAWKVARTEEPGGLQSMVSQRVGHS